MVTLPVFQVTDWMSGGAMPATILRIMPSLLLKT
jgi:hypothetical protein